MTRSQKQTERWARMLLLGAVVFACGCNRTRYELVLTCQGLQKNPNGQVLAERKTTHRTFYPGGEFGEGWALGTVAAPGGDAQTSAPARGDAGVSQQGRSGSFSVRVKRASLSRAVLQVGLNGTKTNLDLVLNSPKEVFDAGGSQGMRITLDEVRITHKAKPEWRTVLLLINLALLPFVILAWKRTRKA